MPTTFLSKKDNAKSTLAADILNSDTSLSVQTGHGGRFSSSNFVITVWDKVNFPDPSDDSQMEKMLVSTRSSDGMSSITRGYDGTSQVAHAAGSAVEMLDVRVWYDEYETAIHSLEALTYPAATFVVGDILYASTTTQLSRLAVSATTNQVLGWSAGLPAWVNPLGITTPYVVGDVVYASTTSAFSRLAKGSANQVLKMASDGSLPQWRDEYGAASIVIGETPSGTINGSNAVFTTAATFASGSLQVFKNGITLKGGGADYTVNASNNGFTMVTAPATGTVLLVNYYKTVDFANVGTNSFKEDETPSGTVNGSNTAFTTAFGYIANSISVYLNGQKLTHTADFTETTPASGTFSFVTAPPTGAIVRVSYMVNQNASGNADTVDGAHASATATANYIPILDSAGNLPSGVLDKILPWRIVITGYQLPNAQSGWSTISSFGTTSVLYGFQILSDGAQNSYIEFPVVLSVGTWSLGIVGRKDTDHGIITFALDGSSIGTLDRYNGGTQHNQFASITGISVTTAGKKLLRLTMATKNASSSAYYGEFSEMVLIRTS